MPRAAHQSQFGRPLNRGSAGETAPEDQVLRQRHRVAAPIRESPQLPATSVTVRPYRQYRYSSHGGRWWATHGVSQGPESPNGSIGVTRSRLKRHGPPQQNLAPRTTRTESGEAITRLRPCSPTLGALLRCVATSRGGSAGSKGWCHVDRACSSLDEAPPDAAYSTLGGASLQVVPETSRPNLAGRLIERPPPTNAG